MVTATMSDDHLIYVRIHDQVGIVRDDDDLAAGACLPEAINEVGNHGPRIEVFFWLVDDERARVVCVYGGLR